MSTHRTLFSIAALLSLVAPCRAEDAKAPPAAAEPMPEEILWMQDVPAAFERAKKDAKPLLIAINAAFVDGGKAEPAGKELRDHTYKAKEVVAKAQLFVCALLKPDATSADYAELRTLFGMDGLVVSPQHIFVHADGTLIGRHEYWPHAHGQPSVDALLKLMDEALAAHKAKTGAGGGPVPTDPAAGVDARAAWIREQVQATRMDEAEATVKRVLAKLVQAAQQHRRSDIFDLLNDPLVAGSFTARLRLAGIGWRLGDDSDKNAIRLAGALRGVRP